MLNKFLERPQILSKCTTSLLTMAVYTSFLKHPNSLFPLLIMSVSFLLNYGNKVHFFKSQSKRRLFFRASLPVLLIR